MPKRPSEPTVDYDALIAEARSLSAYDGSTLERLADALVQLRDERDAAREAHEDTITSDIATLRRRTRERDEALAVIERAKGRLRRSWTNDHLAMEAQDALDTIDTSALDAVKAAAWGEGYGAGWDDAENYHGELIPEFTHNPHRRETP